MKFIYDGNDSSRKLEYEIEYYDRYDDDYENFKMLMHDNTGIETKSYCIDFDYDIKEGMISSYQVLNQDTITKEEYTTANRCFSLLNEEIKKVCKFMLSMF